MYCDSISNQTKTSIENFVQFTKIANHGSWFSHVSLHTEEKSNSLEALRIPGMCGLPSLCTCLCNEDYFIKPSCASAEEIPSLIITRL